MPRSKQPLANLRVAAQPRCAHDALVRFHLGVLLLWIRDVQDARAQLEKAAATMPVSLYSREAKSLLSRLEGIGT